MNCKCGLLRTHLVGLLMTTSGLLHPLMAENADWWISGDGAKLVSAAQVLKRTSAEAKQEIIVAVIDGGFDFKHPQLAPWVWSNQREIPGNSLDDDRNGYIDDVHGWNFLGTSGGESFTQAGTEAFRQYKLMRKKFVHADTLRLNRKEKADYKYYKWLEKEAKLDKFIAYERHLRTTYRMFEVCDSLMKMAYPGRSTTINDFYQIDVPDTTGVMEALNLVGTLVTRFPREREWNSVVKDQYDRYQVAAQRVKSLDDLLTDPHLKNGQPLDNFTRFDYGNAQISASPEHGTMVAGLVQQSVQTLGGKCRIMGIRAIPDGDEYDRDVAAAIRYAVDNGARIINMSFGKRLSPFRKEVEKAIAYAARKGVLLVKAAGNDGKNTDSVPYFPTPVNSKNKRWTNMITVGSSDSKGAPASFTNYGPTTVDLLVPGTDLKSTAAGGGYETADGTSLSTPIVSGVAAALLSYFPDLKASEIKELLMQTVSPITVTPVGGKSCISNGVLNVLSLFDTVIRSDSKQK